LRALPAPLRVAALRPVRLLRLSDWLRRPLPLRDADCPDRRELPLSLLLRFPLRPPLLDRRFPPCRPLCRLAILTSD
jgi:hypothetical protein